MEKNQITAKLLKRLEEGTDAIYRRYESLIQSGRRARQMREKELAEEGRSLANQIAAQSRIDLKNTLEKMADSGLQRSGETVQAQIAANADRNRALATVAKERQKGINELALEEAKLEAGYRQEAEEAVREWQSDTMDAIRDAESLGLGGSGALSGETGVELEKDPYEMLSALVERHTRNYPKYGYKVIQKKELAQALDRLMRDEKISYRYRYELYLYASSLGYYPAVAN